MNENTKITIDLEEELTSEELSEFKKQAKNCGADSLTKHFLNITIKKEGVA